MIYFDNASTSRLKPESVYDAFNYYVREIGISPGRGSYSLGVEASRLLYKSRKAVAGFFGIDDPSHVVFTKNSTEAINLFLNGFLQHGDHVLISPYEHNAVLRPLHNLKLSGIIDYTVLPEEAIYAPKESLRKYIKPNTRLAAFTLASNLTGQLVFSKGLAEVCKENGLYVFVDSSQGAGKGILNMARDNIDVLAFTGHKDLFALPGVGGLCSIKALGIKPLIQGGTGVHGHNFVNPEIYPDAYEAGTLNMPAIWSLKTSIEFINDKLNQICMQEDLLIKELISGLQNLDNVVVYNADRKRVATVCFNVKGMASSDVVAKLDRHGICVRGGIHCTILAHETLGTVDTGAVRASINYFNTLDEVHMFVDVIGGIK
ncbi:MAG: aminotransferase class V-fold PLP-dependent enzyme [Caulobacteraceae bacterium]